MRKELRQFICRECPGKYSHHKYRVWHGWVDSSYKKSQCHICKKMIEAVEHGKEEGVHNCNFRCQCGHTFVVHCEMSDTADCHRCDAWSSPHSFQPWHKINRISDNVHSCSKCNGRGNCPNKRRQGFGREDSQYP